MLGARGYESLFQSWERVQKHIFFPALCERGVRVNWAVLWSDPRLCDFVRRVGTRVSPR